MPPHKFSWLIEGKLAGSGQPGSGETEELDLQYLEEQGIKAILNLAQTVPAASAMPATITAYKHLPVADFMAPDLPTIQEAIAFIEECHSNNMPVLVHCLAGYGRTGTMLACYLVKQGKTSEQAIAEVRAARPGSIESPSQEAAIKEYFQYLKTQTKT